MKPIFHHLPIIFGCLIVFLSFCTAFPVQLDVGSSSDGQAKEWRMVMGALVAAALVLCLVVIVVQCLCCDIKPRRISLTHQNGARTPTAIRENGALSAEFTIFPPVGSQQLVDQRNNDDVKFEPLPDIHPRRQNSVPSNQKPRPATFSNVVTKGLSLRDWFEDPHSNFPRKQLQYVRELGSGWFGQVVEGEAYGIIPTQRKTKVVVKILMEGANTTDQMYFLHEVKPFRDLSHPNVLKLLGKCLESDPFLIILEHCAFKDLKSYLVQHRTEAESLFHQNLLLRMMCNVAAGLQHVHEHGFVLTDLAARNCVVSSDLVVKLGDYGNSIELHKDDYYCAGGIAVPVRWCAPETLRCTETIMETREVTQEANIWSFGVLLWEILEFGKLPYIELSDDELIQKVIIDRTEVLRRPLTPYSHVNRLYQIIQLCQLSPRNRPSMEKIHAMLTYLYSYKVESPDSAAEFEARWNQLQPRKPPAKTTILSCDGSHVVDLGSSLLNSDGDSLVVRELSSSPHPSLSYDSDFGHPIIISPSLQNLHGSVDDLRIDADSRKSGFVSQDLMAVSTESFSANGFVRNSIDQDSRTESALSFHDVSSRSVQNVEMPSLLSLEVSSKGLDEHGSSSKEVSPFTREVQEVIRKLDEDLDRACPSLSDGLQGVSHSSIDPAVVSEDTKMDSSLFGDESYLNSMGSEVDYDSLSHDASGIAVDRLEEVKENSDDDDDLSWRKIVETNNEQSGEITRMIREKSQSVQDFLKLTVIDSESGSDSDGVPNCKNDSASSGEGDTSPKALRRQIQVRRRQSADDILLDVRGEEGRGASGGDGLTRAHAVAEPWPGSSLDPVHADAIPLPSSVKNISRTACADVGDAVACRSLDCLARDVVTDSLTRAWPEVLSTISRVSSQNTACCTNHADLLLDNSQNSCCSSAPSLISDASQAPVGTHCLVPQIVVEEPGEPPANPLEENGDIEESIPYRPKSGLNFRFVFKSLDEGDDACVPGGVKNLTQETGDISAAHLEMESSPKCASEDISFSSPDRQPLPSGRTSTPHGKSTNEDGSLSGKSYNSELDVFTLASGIQGVSSDSNALLEFQLDSAENFFSDGGAISAPDNIQFAANSAAQNEELLSFTTDCSLDLREPTFSANLSDHDSGISTQIIEGCNASSLNGSSFIPQSEEKQQTESPNVQCRECASTELKTNDNFTDALLSSGYCSDQSNSRTVATDQLLFVADEPGLVVVEQNCSLPIMDFPLTLGNLSSVSKVQHTPAANNECDVKLIDFDEIIGDEHSTAVLQSGAASEMPLFKMEEMVDLIDGIQPTITFQSTNSDSSVRDEMLSSNGETSLRDVEASVNGSVGEFSLVERRSLSTPDDLINSECGNLHGVDGSENVLSDDSLNGNFLPESVDLMLDCRSVNCGAMDECCRSLSPAASVQNDPSVFLSGEAKTIEETDPDEISLDEGFEPSESSDNSRTLRTETGSHSMSHPEPMPACSHSTEADQLLPKKNANTDYLHLLGSNSSLYSAEEDCIMLVDLETNEAILVDPPKSRLAFAQSVPEACPDDTDYEDGLSSSSVSPTLPKNGGSSVSSMKETSASIEPGETGLGEESSESVISTSKSEETDDESVGHGTTQTSSSSGYQPTTPDRSSGDTLSSSPSKSKDSDTPSSASEQQFVTEGSPVVMQAAASENGFVPPDVNEEEERRIGFSRFKVQKMDPQTTDALSVDTTPEMEFLMQLTSKMEKLGLSVGDGAAEPCPNEIAVSSDKDSTAANEGNNAEDGPNGCIPPTSSPVNGRSIPNDRLLSPQWETSTDSSSSPSSCHSPSSASSTSGEFDCSKDFKFESYKVQEVAGVDDDDDEDNQADDEGGYGDDEGEEDEDSLIDSFKVSTWDKDATPTKGLLRSPDKQFHSEGKKTVSFKLQKKSVIYEYPKEEVEDEESSDRQGGHSVWTYHMYNPGLDYSSYTDWDLEEVVPDVGVEEFDDDGSSESSSDFVGQPKHPDQAQTLYKLSDIPDEDLASDYSSEGGTGGSASYYADPDSFDFASYLGHYNGSPFYSSVPSENQVDEDFWLETILNSGDFFVSGSDCPFDFDGEAGDGGEGLLPQWALTPGTYNMYVDVQDGSERLNGSGHPGNFGTGHSGREEEEDDEEDDGEHVQYEREGHISRMGEYQEEEEEEEEEDEDEEHLTGAKDNGEGQWDDVESGESAESDLQVAMETDSTDDNLDEVKADKVTNLINNNLLSPVVSETVKTNADPKPSAPQINGTENSSKDEVSTADWNGSPGKSSEDNLINRRASQLETAA